MDALNTRISPSSADLCSPVRSSIDGLWSRPLKVMPGKGGPVLHMLRADSPHFTAFGEIYFSLLDREAIKAWKKHRRQSQNFACPQGRILLAAYDERENSPSLGRLETFVLGLPDDYRLLHVPPGIIYGFTALDDAPAVLANCADLPHDPEESESIPADSPLVPYTWGVKC